MGIKWKKSERDLLRSQLEAGVPWRNAVVSGKTSDDIRRHVRRYNLAPGERHPALTKDQEEKLRKRKAMKFSAREISEFDMLGLPHRTANAVQKILGNIGEVGKNRSLAGKNRKRWLNGEKEGFDIFLIRNSKRFAPRQIAERFGVVSETVTARQRFLRVRPSRAESREIPYFKKKTREANRVRSRKLLLAFKEYIVKKERQLEALKVFLPCNLQNKLWHQLVLFAQLRCLRGKTTQPEKNCEIRKKIFPKTRITGPAPAGLFCLIKYNDIIPYYETMRSVGYFKNGI